MKAHMIDDHIEEWYLVKPCAIALFGDHSQEKYWIKNAWLYLREGLPEGKRREIEINARDEEVSPGVKLWILALYELYWQFKRAIDFDPYDHELESWAERIQLDLSEQARNETLSLFPDGERDSSDRIDALMREKQPLFVSLIKKKFRDEHSILKFMLNTDEVMPRELFVACYCRLHEQEVNSYDAYATLEESEYLDYRREIEIDVESDFFKQGAAMEWVSSVFGV
jgi:hypothetical protein